MSMTDYPCSGYVVKATDFVPLFSCEKERNEFEKYIKLAACEELQEMMNSCLKDIPLVSEVFILQTEDTSQDLESDIMYVRFDEGILYVKTPSPMLLRLQSKDIYPELASWSTWG